MLPSYGSIPSEKIELKEQQFHAEALGFFTKGQEIILERLFCKTQLQMTKLETTYIIRRAL